MSGDHQNVDDTIPAAVALVLARVEGKIDAILASLTTKVEIHGREIGDLRTQIGVFEERSRQDNEKLERRVRATEQRSCVSWPALGSVVVGQISAVGGVVTLLAFLSK